MYRPVCYSRPRLLYIIWMLMLTALPYFPLISEASQVQQSLPYARHHIDINAENVQMKAGLDDKRTESHRSSSTFADIYPPTPSPASPASSASSVSLPPPLSPSALSASSSLLNLRSRDKRRGRIRGRRRRREVEAEDTSSGGNRRGPQSLLQTRERRRAGLEAESMLQSKSTVTRTRNRASMSTDPADLKSGPAQYKVGRSVASDVPPGSGGGLFIDPVSLTPYFFTRTNGLGAPAPKYALSPIAGLSGNKRTTSRDIYSPPYAYYTPPPPE